MITLHTGKLGAGKSYWATRDAWKKIKAGTDCYVNWKIDFTDLYLYEFSGLRGFIRKWWAKLTFGNEKLGKVYYWESSSKNKEGSESKDKGKLLKDLYDIRNGELYFDEAHTHINSRDWKNLDPDFVSKLTQSRKYGLNMHFISQHQGQVDVIVRRLCNDIVKHSKFWKLFSWKEWDGEAIEILMNPAMPQPKSQGFGYYFFNKRIAKSYDTFALFNPVPAQVREPMWDVEKVLAQKSATAGRSVVDRV